MKAVAGMIGHAVQDKSKKNFFCYVFARMVNATEMSHLCMLFEHLCVLCYSVHVGARQQASLEVLKICLEQTEVMNVEVFCNLLIIYVKIYT